MRRHLLLVALLFIPTISIDAQENDCPIELCPPRSSILKLIPLIIDIRNSSLPATVIKSYDFEGDLTDTLGNGLDLVASGGVIVNGRYTFEANQGLRLNSALPNTSGDYTIEIKFQMVSSSPIWKKVIDYQNLQSQGGLYVRGLGTLTGTFVGDTRVGEELVRLGPGDTVRIEVFHICVREFGGE